jgi:Zn-dependent protease
MSLFYNINSPRFTFQEYWRGTRSPAVIFAWLAKLLRIPLPSSNDDPNVVSLQPFQVEENQLPPEILSGFQPRLLQLAGLGFVDPVFHAIIDPLTATKIFWATLRHESGRAWARIHHRIWTQTNPPRVHSFPIFVTAFEDGTYCVSSGGKPDTIAPKTVQLTYSPGADAAALWQAHQTGIAADEGRIKVLRAREDLLAAIEQHHAVLRDFHVRRKLFTPRTDEQDQQAAAMLASIKAAEAAGSQHAEVLAEMDRLQRARPGWGNAIIIFVISMLIFAGVGSAQWSWKIALLLVPILIFHELGHYVAMRLFKYRNLRIFFIPFFGAAVSGQNYNVPGWKRVIVSLMGPLPGIVLGAILAAIGLIFHQPWVTQLALLTLILNAFNLLPFLPLDGGWVLHAILFSRHYMLDIAFRALAAIALICASLFTKDRILMWIGIPMLIFLPVSYKLARTTAKLRDAGLPPVSPDDQTVPTPTAQAIVTELKASFPKGVNNKSLAQYALHIFETLNARPPGWLASIAFLVVHAGSVLMAIVFVVLLVVGGQGSLSDFAKAAANAPQRKLDCNSLWTFGGEGASQSTPRQTVVASFPGRSKAEAAWRQATNGLPPEARARLIGESVLVAFPAEAEESRAACYQRLQLLSTNIAVHSTNFQVSFTLSCIASNAVEAQAIEEELENYMSQTTYMHLIPPWSPAFEADRARFQKARRTYARAQTAEYSFLTNSALRSLSKRTEQARRAGDSAKLAQLAEEGKATRAKLRDAAINGVRAEGPDKIDMAVMDEYLAQSAQRENQKPGDYSADNYTTALRQVGARLGQLPLKGDKPDPAARHTAVSYGSCRRTGLLINLYTVSFYDPAEGVPALVDWLCRRGCIGFQYDFHFYGALADLDDAEKE